MPKRKISFNYLFLKVGDLEQPDVYEIDKVRTITSKEAKQTKEDDAESKALRLAFELRYVRKQYADFHSVDASKWVGYTY